MNGPEHFAAAAAVVANESVVNSPDERTVGYLLAGLIHAVQANTAATLLANPGGAVGDGWAEALGYGQSGTDS